MISGQGFITRADNGSEISQKSAKGKKHKTLNGLFWPYFDPMEKQGH
jgi:hypothetical protein